MSAPPRLWVIAVLAACLSAVSMGSIPACISREVAAGSLSQEIPFQAADSAWNADELGNHRAVLRVSMAGRAAHAVIPWRRRDEKPEAGNIIVTSEGGERIANVRRGNITSSSGELWFEPVSGPGRYFVYYRPYRIQGRSNYPVATYPPPENTAKADWLQELSSLLSCQEAAVERIESIDEFNSFYPMEVAATDQETRSLVDASPREAFLVFPEDRMHPVRMSSQLPYRWIRVGASGVFSGEALRSEHFAFQLAVYALEKLDDVRIVFSDLLSASGRSIPSSALSCINTSGIDWNGASLVKSVEVPAGNVQPMWCVLEVPPDAVPGVYNGAAMVSARGRTPAKVRLEITVLKGQAVDGGVHEPWKQTCLPWLNSTLGQENDVIAPYTPLRVQGNSISLLGRRIALGDLGLPKEIEAFFSPEMTSITNQAQRVLAEPMELVAELHGGEAVAWKYAKPAFSEISPGTVRWEARAGSDSGLEMTLKAAMEFDGFISCLLSVTAQRRIDLKDIRLLIPYARPAATYMMGLGQKGGYRPARYDWKWNVAEKNQDGAWIGGVNAGLFFSLRGSNYVRPLNTNFYLQKPLNLPPSWGNEGKGGITVAEQNGKVLVTGYSGPRTLEAGEAQEYDFNLIVTPFHPIDTDAQWAMRFYHRYEAVDAIKATGATVINIHHATEINPWINYPFIAHREMKAYIDEAHAKGLKVKIYNTVRELSTRAYELFALRSLGHEIFSSGPGGGYPWLQEHLGQDYIAAWFVPRLKDAAIINSGMSRWHNYYVEGMNWLVRQVGIDGIYLDDVAFDRTTMKRIKRVLTSNGHPGILDLHSANQFNPRDGFINSAVLYLEHFPYLNRLWFGEYFDYQNSSPEFFLTEISGIPFGLMGEMLQDGGHPWRGMLYGMTNRIPWNEKSDPRPIWKVWDEFGMRGTRMIGYWVPGNPVQTGRADMPATVYVRQGAALVALANWADADVEVRLKVDWKALDLNPAEIAVEAPEVKNFQVGRRFVINEPIPVPKGRGWMLILKEGRS